MKGSPGQIALVALLVMVVLLTVGLAVVSRSVTDIRISKETAESARAFSAAEAGIEEALKHDLAVWTPPDEGVSVGELTAKVTVAKTASFEKKIEKDETSLVNLRKENGEGWEGDLEVEWDGQGLELTLFYQTGGKWEVKREAFRRLGTACGGLPARPSPTTFGVLSSTSGFKKFLRVKTLCSSARVKINSQNPSDFPLPDQAYTIRSSVTVPESGQTRALEATKFLPILPPTFDYVLYSGSGLMK